LYLAMEESLVKWVNTFDKLSGTCNSLQDLSDGVMLFEILSQVVPRYFDVSSLKRDVQDNWVLKVNNIKKITNNLDRFYHTELGIHDEVNIDETIIGRDQDAREIVKLLQLILGVVVECENKVEYIGNIMNMNAAAQRELMVIIEEIISKHQHQMSGDHSHDDSTLVHVEDARRVELQRQLEQLHKEREEDKQQYLVLKRELSTLMDEAASLQAERDSLKRTVDTLTEELAAARREAEARESSTRHPSLQAIEDERAIMFANQIEERERAIAELKKRVEELGRQAQEARSLRDELDIMREKVLKAEGLEEKLKNALKKAEQVGELKKQIKSLQEQNDNYMKQALDAEESVQKAQTLRSQLESYKQQVVDLKAREAQLEASLRVQQSEADRLRVDLSTSRNETSALRARVSSLSAEVDSLRHSSNNSDIMDGGVISISSGYGQEGSLADEGLIPAVKERLARLERENRRLKEEKDDQLDEAHRLIEALKKELELVRTNGGSVTSPDAIALQTENEGLKVKLHQLQDDSKKKLEEINTLLKEKQELLKSSPNSEEMAEKLKSAAEKIATLSADKSRLEGYLRTAKTMIKELREQKQEVQAQEVQKMKKQFEDTIQSLQKQLEDTTLSLRNQLKEKEKEVEMVKRLFEEGKESSAREQKLMISAFYEMGLELQRLKAPRPNSNALHLVQANMAPSSPSSTPATPRSLLASLRRDRD
jgi:chromosome segregation ATPase